MGGLSHTVSGDIASFQTPFRVPIESLKFHFLPKQEGSGDPSPTNIRPITGWTGLTGRRAGKNLIEPHYGVETEQRGLTITPSANGISVSGTASARTAVYLSKTNKNTKLGVGDKVTFSLYLNGDISECELPFLGYYKSPSVWGGVIGQLSSENNRKITWTVPNTYTDNSLLDSYIYVPQGVTVNFEIGLQMEKGTNATAYKPHFEEQIPITFPSNGKNLFDKSTLGIELQPYNLRLAQNSGHGNPFLLRKGFTYTFSCNSETRPNEIRIMIPYTAGSIKYVYNKYYTTYTPSEDMYVGLNFYWTNGRPEDATDFQIELGSARTSYEPYSSDNTFYGGYIDPVAGEIVATHAKCTVLWGEGGTNLGSVIRQALKLPFVYKTEEELHDSGQGPYRKRTLCNILTWRWDYYADSIHYYIHGQYAYAFLPSDTQIGTEIEFCAELATPIHIPIPAQDLKAFLDHNNFWSDANDITEVTYPVTESKDILATRKKAIAFDHAHHKKVKWNQLVPISSINNSLVHGQSNGSILVQGTTDKTDFIILTSKTQYFTEITGHKYFLCGNPITNGDAQMLTTTHYRNATLDSGYGTVYESERDSDTVRLQMRLVAGTYDFTIVPVFIDLTVMFGAGKEPSTVDEFKHICEINGIDLTTYQPYDEGSDRWLIVP